MTLWGQGGSTVIRGNMLVVPIKNSLLYIEPVYLTTNNEASFPELKRIIVAYGDKISMQPSLREALAVIFGSAEPVSYTHLAVPPRLWRIGAEPYFARPDEAGRNRAGRPG